MIFLKMEMYDHRNDLSLRSGYKSKTKDSNTKLDSYSGTAIQGQLFRIST